MSILSCYFCAFCLGHDEVERLLLSRGASVDIAYFHGTPLHIAAAYGKASVMKVLLEHDADVRNRLYLFSSELLVLTLYNAHACGHTRL